ncbi:MAG: C25 family peptidase propeptide domain-containing protein, partial [bacterium]
MVHFFRPKLAGCLSFLILIYLSGEAKSQGSDARRADLKIVGQSENGLRFQYTPQLLRKQKISTETGDWTQYRYVNTSILSNPGEPEIPVRTFVFGIPNGALPTVRLLSESVVEEANVDLVPVPLYHYDKADLPELDYPEEYSLPNDSDWFPRDPVIVEAPAYVGEMRVVRVHVVPFQYNAKTKTVRRFRNLDLRLDFAARAPGVSTNVRIRRISKNQERFYQRAVLNFDQAKNWIGARRESILKPTRYWAPGDHYKFSISEDGIYRLTGEFLQSNGVGISSIDPTTIKIFNNGPEPLPLDINASRPDSLVEIAIEVVGMEDDRFDASDYIQFYAVGVRGWKYSEERERLSHFINPYTHNSVYWLTFNDGTAGKRMRSLDVPPTASTTTGTHKAVSYVENDINNIHRSGRIWYGAQFNLSGEKSYPLSLPSMLSSSQVEVRARFLSVAGSLHQFDISIDGSAIGTVSYSGSRINESTLQAQVEGASSAPNLLLRYTSSASVSIAYLDWIEVSAESELRLVEDRLEFFGEPGNDPVEYRIEGATGVDYRIFDITDLDSVGKVV